MQPRIIPAEPNDIPPQEDAETQAVLKSSGRTIDQALQTFVDATHSVIANAKKTPVVWEELALNHDIELGKDTIAL